MGRLWLLFLLASTVGWARPDYGLQFPLKDGEYRLETSRIRYLAKCKEPVIDHSGKPVVTSGTYLVEMFLKGVAGKWVVVKENASSALKVEGQFLVVPRVAAEGSLFTLQNMQIVGTELFLYPFD